MKDELLISVVVCIEQQPKRPQAGGYKGEVALLLVGEWVAFCPAPGELGEIEEHVRELRGHEDEMVISQQVPTPGPRHGPIHQAATRLPYMENERDSAP